MGKEKKLEIRKDKIDPDASGNKSSKNERFRIRLSEINPLCGLCVFPLRPLREKIRWKERYRNKNQKTRTKKNPLLPL